MNMFRILKVSLPYLKSIFKAYKDTTGAKGGNGAGDQSFFDRYFSSVLAKNNLGVPPLT